MRVGDFISQKKEATASARQQPSLSQSKSFAQSVVYSIDPEYEAFQALKRSICSICKKENIKSKNDKRLIKIINKYKDRYPALTPELILEEVEAEKACLPSSVNYQDNNNSNGTSTHLDWRTPDPDKVSWNVARALEHSRDCCPKQAS